MATKPEIKRLEYLKCPLFEPARHVSRGTRSRFPTAGSRCRLVVLSNLFTRTLGFSVVDILARILQLRIFAADRHHAIRSFVGHAAVDCFVIPTVLLWPMLFALDPLLAFFP
jgi:hypothetical protein